MKVLSHLSITTVLLCLSAIAMPTALLAVPPDRHKPVKPRTGEAQARRMTIHRLGYANALPDSATIEVPFSIEGATAEEMEGRRIEMLRPLREIVERLDRSANPVYISRSESVRTVRADGKAVLTEMGVITVSVRNIANFKAIVSGISRTKAGPMTAHLRVSDPTVLYRATKRAQLNAIAIARREADVLAKAAGTKIVGVWELNEGERKFGEAADVPIGPRGDYELPAEILAATGQITIVFEMAPSRTP